VDRKNKVKSGIGGRFRIWRKGQGYKAYKVCEMIKELGGALSQGSLSDIENEKSDPSAETLRSWYLLPEIDLIYILTGLKNQPTFRSPEMIRVGPEYKFIEVCNTLISTLQEVNEAYQDLKK